MKPKVHTLTSENEYKLIGIASHLSPHKISWMFNQELDAKFQQADSVVIIETTDKEEHRFPVYKFEDEGDILYTLYANKLEYSSIIKSIK
ncbi:MAG: IPExxxVDY family protein, partial [Chloroflexia bacterium]|nr:IPExxxVDY family protein [Chloroflexia bacterium]